MLRELASKLSLHSCAAPNISITSHSSTGRELIPGPAVKQPPGAWEFDTSSPVAEAVSEPTNYGFVNRITTSDGTGIPGGVGGGASYESHAIFYVGVPNVEAALQRAESLGGKRQMGPVRAPTGLVVGHFTDPEGNLIGVAGTA